LNKRKKQVFQRGWKQQTSMHMTFIFISDSRLLKKSLLGREALTKWGILFLEERE
jgi:hypothetical protein